MAHAALTQCISHFQKKHHKRGRSNHEKKEVSKAHPLSINLTLTLKGMHTCNNMFSLRHIMHTHTLLLYPTIPQVWVPSPYLSASCPTSVLCARQHPPSHWKTYPKASMAAFWKNLLSCTASLREILDERLQTLWFLSI